MWTFSILLVLSAVSSSFQYSDEFHEELVIKPLKTGHVYNYFQFTTKWDLDKKADLHHSNLVSRSIAEIFLHYPINELHVSLTNSIFRYKSWGYPVIDAAPGSEILAWFDDTKDIDQNWKQLCGTLSGLLCASLSFVDETNTNSPIHSFKPTNNARPSANSSFVRYAQLPHEIVCTENLTPWKKLLPCDHQNGLASLLKSENIYTTSYNSMGIHVRRLCTGPGGSCDKFSLEVKQTINLVHDLQLFGGADWSIRKLFSQGLHGICDLATSSKIYVDMTDSDFSITPKPAEMIKTTRGGADVVYGVYDLNALLSRGKMFNLAAVSERDANMLPILAPPPIHTKRFLLGVGQEKGKIVTRITNTHWAPLNVVQQETIPWYVPIYLHTLRLTVGDTVIKPIDIKYIPGQQRRRPYHLEVAFQIPARSTLELSVDFDYVFLKWQEYPPDANHGHYIGAATISTMLPTARNYTSVPIDGSLFADSFNATRSDGYFLQLRTEALLITLPTPDFSMPYNVICLACTVVALAFGPIHNLSTKKITIQHKDAPQSMLGRLKQRFTRKKQEKTEEVGGEDEVKGEVENKKDK